MLKTNKLWIGFTPFIFFIILAGLLMQGLWREPVPTSEGLLNHELPNFYLPDLLNPEMFHDKAVFESDVALINIWATWCGPCAHEHPFLVKLAQERRVPIFGLNYHDERSDAIKWLSEKGDPYRTVMFDPNGRTAIDWGIVGVPETMVIDKQGVVRYRHQGVLTEEIWLQEILPVVELLESKITSDAQHE